MAHICVSKLTIIGSDNGLSPDRRQAIFWTNAGLLLIGPLGTNFSEILIEILTFSFKKMRLKVSSAKRRPYCLGLNVLKNQFLKSRRALWIISPDQRVRYLEPFGSFGPRNIDENMPNFALASSVAGTKAGMLTTKFGACIWMEPTINTGIKFGNVMHKKM